MKKYRSIALIVMMSMLLLTSASALPLEQLREVADIDLQCAAVFGENLALYDSGNYAVYGLSAEEDALRRIPSVHVISEGEGERVYRSVMEIVSDGERAYAVEWTVHERDGENAFTEAELYALDFERGEHAPVASLDLSDALYDNGNGTEVASCNDALMSEGKLLLLFDDPTPQEGLSFSTAQFLLVCDLARGSSARYELSDCIALLGYANDKILIARGNAQGWEVVQIDLSSMQEKPLAEVPDGRTPDGVALSASRDTVYYLSGSLVNAIKPGGKPQTVGRAPFLDVRDILELDAQRAVVFSQTNAACINVDWDYKGSDLRLSVAMEGEMVEAFAASRPDVDVEIYQMGGMSLNDLVLTRASQPDVFRIDAHSNPYRQPRDRGYLLLLESAQLQEYARHLHPDLLAASQVDGALCAIPIEILPQSLFGVAADKWDEQVFGAPPTTWDEFIDFLKRYETLGEQYPEYQLMDSVVSDAEQMHGMLLERLIAQYDSWRHRQEGAVGYDNETFRRLAQRLNELDYDVLFSHGAGAEPNPLLTAYYLPIRGVATGWTPIPLELSAEISHSIDVRVIFLAINPYSENRELAIEFLEACASRIEPEQRMLMCPDANEPIRSEGYETLVADANAQLAEIERKLRENEDPVEQLPLEEELRSLQAHVDSLKDSWAVSPEDIQLYRSLTERMNVMYRTELSDEERMNVYQIRMNFMAGNLSIDEFIEQMDRKILMQELENR